MTAKDPPIIVWIRRDLRLADNPALAWATRQKKPVVVVFIVETGGDQWTLGSASKWWLHHSLKAFNESLKKAGSGLFLYQGRPEVVLREILSQTRATTLVWNRRYEPASIEKDRNLKEALTSDGINARSFHGNLYHEPWQVMRSGSHPYRVFSAYWRASLKVESIRLEKRVRTILPYTGRLIGQIPLQQLHLLPELNWADAFTQHWQPGEHRAQLQLATLIKNKLADYQRARDIPGIDGTSRLSPHLAFGEISPRMVHATIRNALQQGKLANDDNTEAFLREIGWREFAYHLLYHYPDTTNNPLDARFNQFPWLNINVKTLHAWQTGNTGIPLIDAGMRQLWKTGWMHNRVRMVVGSFLIKNLGYHWLTGADWFWDTLVDADLASNSMGWQWVAGSGADAAPYFRVFNPVRQGERFDKEGTYVRQWVPEVAELSNKYIHAPWTAPENELMDAGITLGETYPTPIVDLSASRHAALARFDKIKR